MKDQDKTKEQLIDELVKLRHRNAEMEKSEVKRKRVEKAQQKQQRELKLILDSVPAAIWYKNTENRMIKVNKAGAESVGRSVKDIEGKTAFELFPEEAQHYYQDDLEVIKSGIPKLGIIELLQTSTKEKKWVRTDKVPYHDEQGNIIGLVVFTVDITASKRAEEELEKYHKHLEDLVEERTKKLVDANAELEMFAHSVSHDLRAPLRAMQGFTQALQEDYASKLDPRGREYAERIINASAHMDTMIQDLLAYSQLSKTEIKLQPVSLKQIVEEIMDQLEVEIKERKAEVNIKTPLPDVKGQQLILTLVISNILKNAITFVASGVKPKITLWAEEHNGWIRLNVEDNGIGIAPEHHEIIFRIFKRLHGIETYPGTGIGLAFVKRGLERMKGKVGVESEIGNGSQFWIELKKGKVKK